MNVCRVIRWNSGSLPGPNPLREGSLLLPTAIKLPIPSQLDTGLRELFLCPCWNSYRLPWLSYVLCRQSQLLWVHKCKDLVISRDTKVLSSQRCMPAYPTHKGKLRPRKCCGFPKITENMSMAPQNRLLAWVNTLSKYGLVNHPSNFSGHSRI